MGKGRSASRISEIMTRKSVVLFVPTSAIAVIVALTIVGFRTAGVGSDTTSVRPFTTQSGGKRPASVRWYAPSSLWNTPIAANPPIAANNASLIAALVSTNGIGPAYDYTPAIWYASSTTPRVAVRIDFPHCGAHTVRVPVPKGAVPDPSSEGRMIVARYGKGTEFDFYKAQSPNQPPKSSVYYSRPCPTVNEWTAAKVVTTNWLTGSGKLRESARGSGTPEGAGTILPRDTQMPPGASWDHALGMSYRNTCSHSMRWCPFVAPATEEDGTCTDRSRCVPEGTRFQLDPSIDCRTWPSLHYEWQRQMCRTFQVFGGIIVDTNGAGPTIYDQWRGSTGSYRWPWLRTRNPGLPNDLLSHFRVLAWR
jgi:hypothetical protein